MPTIKSFFQEKEIVLSPAELERRWQELVSRLCGECAAKIDASGYPVGMTAPEKAPEDRMVPDGEPPDKELRQEGVEPLAGWAEPDATLVLS